MVKPWLKLWTCARSDAKLRCLSDKHFRIWFNLLCLVREQSEDGIIRLPIRVVAAEVCNDGNDSLLDACNELASLHLVTCVTDESKTTIEITFPKFVERQKRYQSDSPERIRARVAKHRKKKSCAKLSRAQNSVTSVVTTSNESVTASNDTQITEVETETEIKTPPNPPEQKSMILGPEFTAVGNLAIELTADFSWGPWVDQQGRIGHPADWIRSAIMKAADVGKLNKPYVVGILRRFVAQGGPNIEPIAAPTHSGKAVKIATPEECARMSKSYES